MSAAEGRFFSGSTLSQAILAAARHYGLAAEEVAYRVREKRHGFVTLHRGVIIEVDPTAPRRAAPAPAPVSETPQERRREPQRAAEIQPPAVSVPAPPIASHLPVAEGPAAEATRQAAEALRALAGLELEVAVLQGEQRLEVEFGGADAEELFARDGELLGAFDHLLPRVARGILGEAVGCRVAAAAIGSRREEELRELARAAAEEVRRSGQSQLLEPMNPAERRVVHLSLAAGPEVITESRGEGYVKRILIRLAQEPGP